MKDQVEFRLATASEKAALEDLQRRASLMWEEDRAALLANPDAIELPLEHIAGSRTIVAEMGGRTVGFAVVLRRDDGDAELDGMFVEPDVWRSGIGRRLMKEALGLASADGARSMHVVANQQAKGFYAACGFIVCGEAQTRFGPALAMYREIAASK